MSAIFSQRKFVKILCDYYENEGVNPTREEFVSYLIKKERFFKGFHLWLKNDKSERLRRKVDTILGDCIEGALNYITYDPETRMKLLATTKGREFATNLGFVNEFLGRYGLIVVVVAISGTFGYFLKAVIAWFSN